MEAQKVFNLLEKVKGTDYEEKTLRLLKLIYSDIYLDKIDDVISYMRENRYNSYNIAPYSELKGGLRPYIDEDSSILTYYTEMICDGNHEFIDAFFDKVQIYFKMIDNNLFRQDDFNPISLILNIYIMLKCYHESKDDFDRYKKLLNDYSSFINVCPLDFDNNGNRRNLCLDVKKDIIDKVTSIEKFDEVSYFKDDFNEFFKDSMFNAYEDDSCLDYYCCCIEAIDRVLRDAKFLKKKYLEDNTDRFGLNNYNPEVYLQVINDIVDSSNAEDDDMFFFYDPKFLFGERYQYINECFEKYVGNYDFMKEILEIIEEIPEDFFDYLLAISDDKKDPFIREMNVVFDSDTFYEAKRKAMALRDLAEKFELSGDNLSTSGEEKPLTLRQGRLLLGDEYKKVVLGKKMMDNSLSMNKIKRPTLIIERMQEVAKKNFGETNFTYYDFLGNFESFENIDDFEENFDNWIEKNVATTKLVKQEDTAEDTIAKAVMDVEDERNKTLKKKRSLFGKK